MSLSTDLLTRAKAGLSNPDEIDEPIAEKAMAEALELVGSKQITNAEKVDIGYFRLMLIMGMELSEIESRMYEKLLTRIDRASSVNRDNDQSTTITQKILVEQGENIYQ